MLLDQSRSPLNPVASVNAAKPVDHPRKTSDMREAARLRELAAWYRDISERAGNPRIWESRLRRAEDLDREADQLEREHVAAAPVVIAAPVESQPLDPRTRTLLEAPISISPSRSNGRMLRPSVVRSITSAAASALIGIGPLCCSRLRMAYCVVRRPLADKNWS